MLRIRRMLRIHLLSVAAATAIMSVLAANGAIAQTASSDQPGKPLSLTQLINPAAAPSGNTAPAVKRTRVRHVASRKHSKAAAQEAEHQADKPAAPAADAAQSNASADAWLAQSAPPANPAPTSPPAQANNPQTAALDHAQQGNAPLPSAVVVNGQTVPIGTAEEVNALDLAADNSSPDNSPTESTQPPGDRADLAAALTAKASQVKDSQVAFAAPAAASQNADSGNAGTQNASAQDASAQNVSAEDTSTQDAGDQSAAAPNSGTVGSASWVAQVLAAVGGAIAAGTLAWFLIGGGPPARDYG